jgi:hypothetical protein
VAGVQAQLIASTSGSNSTKLEIATNAFGFAGLVLDILGTSAGVIYALRFRKTVSRWPDLLKYWVERQQDVIDKVSSEIAGTGFESATDYILQALHTEIQRRRLFWMSVGMSSNDSIRAHLASLLRTDQTIGPFTISVILSNPGIRSLLSTNSLNGDLDKLRVLADDDPRIAIGAGIACLLVSVVFFAASSQPRLVWVISAVTTFVFALNLLMSMLTDIWSGEMKSRLFHHCCIRGHVLSVA